MNTTAKNPARKTAAQRATESVLNGHDKTVEDVEAKNEAPRAKREGLGATDAQYAYSAYCSSLGVPMQNPVKYTDLIIGFVGSAAAIVLGYALGLQLVDLLAYGVYLLTGWNFLALAVWIIGMLITLVATMYTGGMIAQYLGTGQYTKDMKRAASWIKSKFSKTETVAV